ncbi:MAG: methyltransferase [Alloprevotella sp.]|nr:methyltransferase [Alloprevotella sp.]
MQEFEIIAKTFHGLEEVLAQEITELGANNIEIGHRMVRFSGDKEVLYRANFCLRTAVRILKPIKRFEAHNPDEVYAALADFPWESILSLEQTFAVNSVINSSEFNHTKFVAYKVKDAIVDYFREKYGKRPNISVTNPQIRLDIHITGTDCTLCLDSSGESLHIRGYRSATVEAPINEVLAAGMIKLSGWKADTDFIDPFCGSGTIAIEAALIARNIYPGLFRAHYAFENWPDFDKDLLQRIYDDDSAERSFDHHIYAYDINIPALKAAEENAHNAGVAELITFKQQDIRAFTQPANKSIMITNPPYGERLHEGDTLGLYNALGERLKKQFKGNEAWIICSRKELFDNLGLRPSVKIELNNGSLPCELRRYQLFDGKLENFRDKGGLLKSEEDYRRNAKKRRSQEARADFFRTFRDESNEPIDEAEELESLRNVHRQFEKRFGQKYHSREKSEDSRHNDFRRSTRTDMKRSDYKSGERSGKPFKKTGRFSKSR